MRETSFSVGIFLLPKMLKASQNSNEKKARGKRGNHLLHKKPTEFCSCLLHQIVRTKFCNIMEVEGNQSEFM